MTRKSTRQFINVTPENIGVLAICNQGREKSNVISLTQNTDRNHKEGYRYMAPDMPYLF